MPSRATPSPALVGRDDLLAGFARLGLRAGDTVLAHSSLSRFGHVDDGARTVIAALREALGPDGTLLMSAITTSRAYVTTCIAAAQQGVLAPVAPFDVAGERTYAGAIAETFRTQPDVLRSWHPTHSVTAAGRLAAELIADHGNAAGPCGAGTPYARLCALDRGFILLLGVPHQNNTTLHCVEELAGLEYVLYPHPVRILAQTPSGPQVLSTRVHNAWMSRDLNVLETAYIDAAAQSVTRIGDAPVRFVHAGSLCSITLAALRTDPLRLLDAKGREAWERMRRSGDFLNDPFAQVPR